MSVIIPIDLGTVPNDSTGNPLRTGGQRINTNFANLNLDKLESGGYTGTGQDLFTLLNNKVSKTGDTMTGDLVMQGVNIKSQLATLSLGNPNILYADINVNDAEYLLAVGKTLTVKGKVKNTALFGLSNTLGDTQIVQNCIIGGELNTIDGTVDGSIIGGVANTHNALASFTIGEGNTNVGRFNVVSGLNNLINGENNIISGKTNNINSINSIIGGNNNTVSSGINNFVIGTSNSFNGVNLMISGLNNQSLSFVNLVSMIGEGLQSQKDNESIFGLYNDPTNDGLLTIGYGTNVSRKNAFIATNLGHIRLPQLENEYKNDAEAFTSGAYIEGEVYNTYAGKLQISQRIDNTINNNVVGNMLSYSGSFIDFGSSSGSVFPTNGDSCQFGVSPSLLADHVGNLAISYNAYISKVSCKWSSQDDFVTDVGTAVVSFKFYKCKINDDVSLPASWVLIHTLTTKWDNTSGSSPGFIEDVLLSNIAVEENTLLAFVAETTVNFAQKEEVEVTLILENR